jgi:RND family efflux transporter MFP subunit
MTAVGNRACDFWQSWHVWRLRHAWHTCHAWYAWIAPCALLLLAAGCSGSTEARKEPAAPAMKVAVVRVERQPLARTVTLAASLEPYEQAPLYAKVAGYVASIAVDIGDRVDEGQVLATLEIPEMAQQHAQAENQLAVQRAEVSRAEAEAELRRLILERSRGLRSRDAITAQDLDQARAEAAKASAELELARARARSAQARLGELQTLMEYARLRAPFAGIVTQRFVDRGALVQAATSSANVSPVVTVARTDTLRAFVDVPEPEVPFVDRADRAVLEVASLPGKRFEGVVTRVAGALDPSSRTMRTEIDFPNPDGILLPGMYGTMTIAVETHANALTLPETAVRRGKTRAVVYPLDGNRAVERVVTTGFSSEGRVEILAGLADGERVVGSVAPGLSDGTPVEVVGPEPGAVR